MDFDKQLIASKLRRWEDYIVSFRLPLWEDIPNFGLYMEQVIVLLQDYLDYLPPDLKEEQFITAATINNYVRKKFMPEPVKKRYYRIHLAYLIMICTLKHSLSISTIHTVLPHDLDEATFRKFYDNYVRVHRHATEYFHSQVRLAAGNILDHDEKNPVTVEDTTELVFSAAVISTFSRVLAEKLLLLEGRAMKREPSDSDL